MSSYMALVLSEDSLKASSALWIKKLFDLESRWDIEIIFIKAEWLIIESISEDNQKYLLGKFHL